MMMKMYRMPSLCRAIDKQDQNEKMTDILLRKQLEQIDKAEKSFIKGITVQQNLTKRRFDDKLMRSENGYAKLWESRNMTNIWLELNQDMNACSQTPIRSCSSGVRKSGQRYPKRALARGKTELGTSSTSGMIKTEDLRETKTSGTGGSEREFPSNGNSNTSYKPKFQRNITFVNLRSFPTDLGDNPKVTPIGPLRKGLAATRSGSKVKPWCSSEGKHRRVNCHLQSHCWGSKFFSDRRHTPSRYTNESRRYSRVGQPTKTFLGGLDVSSTCFADISLNRNAENYERKIKSFCDSLQHLILTSTTNDQEKSKEN